MPQWRNASDYGGDWSLLAKLLVPLIKGLVFSFPERNIIPHPLKVDFFQVMQRQPFDFSLCPTSKYLIISNRFKQHLWVLFDPFWPSWSGSFKFFRGFDERRSEESPARRCSQQGPHRAHHNGPVGPTAWLLRQPSDCCPGHGPDGDHRSVTRKEMEDGSFQISYRNRLILVLYLVLL